MLQIIGTLKKNDKTMQSNLYAYIPRDESFSVYDLVLGPGCPGRGKVGSSVQVWVRPPPEHPTTSGTGDKKGGGWRRQQQLRVVKFDTAGLIAKACEYLTEICKTWPNGVPTEQFAKEFLHALERENEAAAAAAAEPTVGAADKLDAYSFSFTTKVLAELQTIGLEHMVAVDDDLRSLTLRVVDQGARAHDVVISLSPTHTRGTITGVSCDLPVTLFDRGRTDKLKISDVYRKFCASVLSLQPLWDELDEIDAMYPSVLGNNKSSAARRIQLSTTIHTHKQTNK